MKLYKYRDISDYTLDILINDRFYFSRPQNFNDPFDCQLRIDERHLTREYCARILPIELNIPKEERAEYFNKVFNNLEKAESLLDKLVYNYKNKIREFYEYFYNIGVLSLTEDPVSILMWGHYGLNHKGVCIEITDEDGQYLTDNRFTNPVVYTDDYPEITLENLVQCKKYDQFYDLIQKVIHTKSSHWSYEKEHRVVIADGDKTFKSQGDITSVIFGLKTPRKFIKEVQAIAQKKNIKLFQTQMVTNRFELKIVPYK